MLRGFIDTGGVIASLLTLICFESGCNAADATPRQPYQQTGKFKLLKDWTFGTARADATVRSRADLDKNFYYRYIFSGGQLDGINTYWSYHRDYPDGDPRSLHVFTPTALVLKGRIPPNGGLHPRGIESGMLRAKFAVTPGMYIEMRAKLTTGIGAWPAFWLEPGVENDDHTFSELPWPPELDIFEFFNWKWRPHTTAMTGNYQTNHQPEKFGQPHDLWTQFNSKGEYSPGVDFAADFHVFALDWRENAPIWVVDGKPIKQTYYEWHAPPAHILVTNQIGIAFADMTGMSADESQWDYTIDYIRVWKEVSVPKPPTNLATH